jgi:hypothetical protein
MVRSSSSSSTVACQHTGSSLLHLRAHSAFSSSSSASSCASRCRRCSSSCRRRRRSISPRQHLPLKQQLHTASRWQRASQQCSSRSRSRSSRLLVASLAHLTAVHHRLMVVLLLLL